MSEDPFDFNAPESQSFHIDESQTKCERCGTVVPTEQARLKVNKQHTDPAFLSMNEDRLLGAPQKRMMMVCQRCYHEMKRGRGLAAWLYTLLAVIFVTLLAFGFFFLPRNSVYNDIMFTALTVVGMVSGLIFYGRWWLSGRK